MSLMLQLPAEIREGEICKYLSLSEVCAAYWNTCRQLRAAYSASILTRTGRLLELYEQEDLGLTGLSDPTNRDAYLLAATANRGAVTFDAIYHIWGGAGVLYDQTLQDRAHWLRASCGIRIVEVSFSEEILSCRDADAALRAFHDAGHPVSRITFADDTVVHRICNAALRASFSGAGYHDGNEAVIGDVSPSARISSIVYKECTCANILRVAPDRSGFALATVDIEELCINWGVWYAMPDLSTQDALPPRAALRIRTALVCIAKSSGRGKSIPGPVQDALLRARTAIVAILNTAPLDTPAVSDVAMALLGSNAGLGLAVCSGSMATSTPSAVLLGFVTQVTYLMVTIKQDAGGATAACYKTLGQLFAAAKRPTSLVLYVAGALIDHQIIRERIGAHSPAGETLCIAAGSDDTPVSEVFPDETSRITKLGFWHASTYHGDEHVYALTWSAPVSTARLAQILHALCDGTGQLVRDAASCV